MDELVAVTTVADERMWSAVSTDRPGVTEHALGDLDDAWCITTANSPIPYSPPLEDAFLPGPDRIAAEVLSRP